MKHIFFVFILCCLISPVVAQEGKLQAYIFLSEDCPICVYMTESIKELDTKYKDKVDIILVFPSRLSNYKTMQLFKEKYGLTKLKGILDEDQSISGRLQAKITPEAILTNTTGQILYKGRINDAYAKLGKMRPKIQHHDLASAIDHFFANMSIVTPWPSAVGCYITYYKK